MGTYAIRCYICICRSVSRGRGWNNTNWVHMSSGSVTVALHRIASMPKFGLDLSIRWPVDVGVHYPHKSVSPALTRGLLLPEWRPIRVYLQLDSRQQSITFQSFPGMARTFEGATFAIIFLAFHFGLAASGMPIPIPLPMPMPRPSLITRV